MSKRSSLLGLGSSRLSRDGFQQIPELDSTPAKMRNPNDATIDIPLTAVTAHTPQRQNDGVSPAGSVLSATPPNEKTIVFKRNAGGRRQKIDNNTSNGRRSHQDGDSLTKMGVVYKKILNFSIVTRYFFYVLPLAIIIATPIVIGATVATGAKAGGVRIVWIFTWVEVVWLSLWISKLAAKCLPFVFQFLCGIVSSGTRKYKLILEALEIPLSLAGWALASLATFKPVSVIVIVSII